MTTRWDQVSVAELVGRAGAGDQDAWREIVRRYLPLVWAIAREHRLNQADAADVSQCTWIKLARHLPGMRNPERLAAWLATSARRECLRVIASRRREVCLDSVGLPAVDGPEPEILRDVRDRVLWQAFAALSEQCRQLLGLLARAPELSYAQLGRLLGLSAGSIGPTRGRCLNLLRRQLVARELHEEAQ